MMKQDFPLWFFVLILAVVLYLFVRVFAPFFMIFLWATILVITSYPLYRRLRSLLRGRESLAALLMVFGLTLLIILPVILLIANVAQQSVDAYVMYSDALAKQEQNLERTIMAHPVLTKAKAVLGRFVNFDQIDLGALVIKGLESASGFIVGQSTNFFSGLAGFMFRFVLLLVATYYFFKDGEKVVGELRKLSPMDKTREEKIIRKFTDITRATMLGTFSSAAIQGVLGGLAFLLIGMPSPLLWGVVMAFMSLVPVLGAFTVWIPAALYLIAIGSFGKAVFIVVYGLLTVTLADNVLKPLIIRGGSKIHPVVIFFSILGGLSFFGFSGIILGPLVTGLTFVVLEIYREEFQEQLPGTMKLSRAELEDALKRVEETRPLR
ncbi:MAG TPA: AI-2E family transporter [Acidobacteriota bacterium]|jgi:predicted PurR-regulated permease PerM|nr:AI-2E family transporter [Acidobacteriota bacterium]HNR39084.1 AI-2E family transporter [Acidobacteriota bacterium]HNU01573.1 AI-2E family transporter [Acidobacteriota bacterium]HPB27019.1 AI-2E family transporter [Acidobacteriota bacterium]HQO26324.1 AI-2E family transporter [Acidobacteriota bacterium]